MSMWQSNSFVACRHFILYPNLTSRTSSTLLGRRATSFRNVFMGIFDHSSRNIFANSNAVVPNLFDSVDRTPVLVSCWTGRGRLSVVKIYLLFICLYLPGTNWFTAVPYTTASDPYLVKYDLDAAAWPWKPIP